jgi:hypothetical protein
MMTDKAHHYTRVGKEFAEYGRVDHGLFQRKSGDWHTPTPSRASIRSSKAEK